MMSGDYEETRRVTFKRVLEWIKEGLGPDSAVTFMILSMWTDEVLGPAPAVYFIEIMWVLKASNPHYLYLPGGHRSMGVGI